MKVGNAHLTYCTNIHAGETWSAVRANLERHVLAVKQRVCPDRPFGVGLRLSELAALELSAGDELARLRAFLDEHGLYVFTINGFPYGTFHGAPVKEGVYRPDWLEPERLAYTERLARILVELLPDGVTGSISTVPGCYMGRFHRDAHAIITENLRRAGAYLAELEARTGKRVVLALEPEPTCLLEKTADVPSLFEALEDRTHLGICLDACHAAVAFEHLPTALATLQTKRIPIHKVQLSCGLRVQPVDAAARRELARFADDVYLHQVNLRHRGWGDLGIALEREDSPEEWRIHFHVPIFRESLGPFSSTQPFLAELLALHRGQEISPHLEVETYTWDVLPPEFRAEPIEDAIARELRWVLERLT